MDIYKIQAQALALLDMELAREVWTLPKTKAERMESWEARYEALVAKLVAQARQYGDAQPAAAQQQSATAPTLHDAASAAPAPAPAPEPPKTEPTHSATDGDLKDEFDSPAF